MGDEVDVGWDGGWTDMVDHGHDLGEYMLEAEHPYDRDDGYIPPTRWATRHDLISQRFSDPASMVDEGLLPQPTAAARDRAPCEAGRRKAQPSKGGTTLSEGPLEPRPVISRAQARAELRRRQVNREVKKLGRGKKMKLPPEHAHLARASGPQLVAIAESATDGVPPARERVDDRSPAINRLKADALAVVPTSRTLERALRAAVLTGASVDNVLSVVCGRGSTPVIAARLGWSVAQVKQVRFAYAKTKGISPDTKTVAARTMVRTRLPASAPPEGRPSLPRKRPAAGKPKSRRPDGPPRVPALAEVIPTSSFPEATRSW